MRKNIKPTSPLTIKRADLSHVIRWAGTSCTRLACRRRRKEQRQITANLDRKEYALKERAQR